MRIFNTIMRSKYVKVKKISDYYHAKRRADKYMKIYNYEEEKFSVAKNQTCQNKKIASLKETWPPACKLKESQ